MGRKEKVFGSEMKKRAGRLGARPALQEGILYITFQSLDIVI